MLLVSTHEACHTVAPLLKMLQLYNNKALDRPNADKEADRYDNR